MDLSRVSKKTPFEDNRMTLSAIDAKTIDNFNKYYETLDDKIRSLDMLKRKKNNCKDIYSNEYFELSKEIVGLEDEIKQIQNKTQQLNYLLKASNYFMEYSLTSDNNQHVVSNFFLTKDKNNRGKICQEYIKECIGDGYSVSSRDDFEISQELTCKNCGIEKLTNNRESYASCPNCGEITKYQDSQNNKGEYSEEVEVLSPFAYKRINHFKEWISTLMGRKGLGPSQEVIDELLRELKKDKVTTREEVTEERIRGYLKKLKYPKLYEHIPFIIYKICGVPPPKISPQLEAKLIEMFLQIQGPFEKFVPDERKNFLSYSYTIHKFLELLGQNHLLNKVPLLKSADKLYQQDQIWKPICKYIGWKFIASL